MLLLAALLSFGWPKEQTVWVPAGTPCPAGMIVMKVNDCCGSMKPALKGGETAYVEKKHVGPYLGFIVGVEQLHRVIAENERAVLTAGDANRGNDGWTPKPQIKYTLRYIVRK